MPRCGYNRNSAELQPHRAAPGCAPCSRLFRGWRGRRGRRGGRCCYFLAPAPRLSEEGCGGAACSTPTPTSVQCTRSCSAGWRCDYGSGGGAIILDSLRKEEGWKSPPELNATEAREPGNAQNRSPSGSPHLKDTYSAFLRLPPLLPLSFAWCENGPRDSELWQRFQKVTWARGEAGRGVRGGRKSNLIPLFILLEFRSALSGAGSKVVVPGMEGRGRKRCRGPYSGTAEGSELDPHPSFGRGRFLEKVLTSKP